MALKHYDVTLAATATPITSDVDDRKGILYVLIHNTGNNSAIYIGDSTVSATSYGHTLASGEEVTIGPFSGAAPTATDKVYIFGTENDVVHALVVTF